MTEEKNSASKTTWATSCKIFLFKNLSWMTNYTFSIPFSIPSTANGKYKKERNWLHVKSWDQLPTWFPLIYTYMQLKPVIIFPTFWPFDIAYLLWTHDVFLPLLTVGSIAWIFRYFIHLEKKVPQTCFCFDQNIEWGDSCGIFPCWLTVFWRFSSCESSVVFLVFVDRVTVSVCMHTAYRTYLFFRRKTKFFLFQLGTSHVFRFIGATFLNTPRISNK